MEGPISTLGDWQELLDTLAAVIGVTNPPSAFRTNLSERLTPVYAILKRHFDCPSVLDLPKKPWSTPLEPEARVAIDDLCTWLRAQSPYFAERLPVRGTTADLKRTPRH